MNTDEPVESWEVSFRSVSLDLVLPHSALGRETGPQT
jgi:hypothetical protein